MKEAQEISADLRLCETRSDAGVGAVRMQGFDKGFRQVSLEQFDTGRVIAGQLSLTRPLSLTKHECQGILPKAS